MQRFPTTDFCQVRQDRQTTISADRWPTILGLTVLLSVSLFDTAFAEKAVATSQAVTIANDNSSTVATTSSPAPKRIRIASLLSVAPANQLKPTTRALKIQQEMSDLRAGQVTTASPLLTKTWLPPSGEHVPAVLEDRMSCVIDLARNDPEMAFSLAAGLCEKWPSPQQTEYICSQVLEACKVLTKDRGLEATLTLFRAFVQKLHNDELSRRAQLRIGRLYYENGEFGKAVLELAVDPTAKNPSDFDTIAGLFKALAMIRLGQSKEALLLLEWVATTSPDKAQREKAAYLLGRFSLFSSDRERARKWLTIIVKTGNSEYVAEAQKLLSQIEDREK
jgi:hypothetical protein